MPSGKVPTAGDIRRLYLGRDAMGALTKPVNKLELTTRVRFALRYRHLSNERDRLLAYLEGVDTLHGEAEPPVKTPGKKSREAGAPPERGEP